MIRILGSLGSAVAVAATLGGCSSGDDGAQYQASLSSVAAAEATDKANVAFATEVLTLGAISSRPAGPERLKLLDQVAAQTCPGSPLHRNYAELREKEGQFAYVPGLKLEVRAAWAEKDPNSVLVVAKTIDPRSDAETAKQARSTVYRIVVGDNAGKKCIKAQEQL